VVDETHSLMFMEGNSKDEVFIYTTLKTQMDLIFFMIIQEIGVPKIIHYHDCSINFVLPPDCKYESFEDFKKWLTSILLQSGYKQFQGYDYRFIRDYELINANNLSHTPTPKSVT
jgi:hypothetical protein